MARISGMIEFFRKIQELVNYILDGDLYMDGEANRPPTRMVDLAREIRDFLEGK